MTTQKDLTFRKKITKNTIFLIILCTIFITVTPTACAEDLIDGAIDSMQGAVNAIKGIFAGGDFILEEQGFLMYMAYTIKAGNADIIEGALENDPNSPYVVYNKLFSFMTGNGDLNGTTYEDFFKDVTAFITALGIVIAICLAFMRIIEKLERGADPVETIFKALMEICIVVVILVDIPDILGYLAQLGSFLAELSAGVVGGSTTVSKEQCVQYIETMMSVNRDDIKDFSFFNKAFFTVSAFCSMLIPWVIALIVNFLTQILVVSIVFEIGIRRIFAPLAACDIYGEGLRSPGVRYLKKYFAVFLKLMICVIINKVSVLMIEVIYSADIELVDSSIVGIVATPIVNTMNISMLTFATEAATVFLMFKLGEFANDIVGVN